MNHDEHLKNLHLCGSMFYKKASEKRFNHWITIFSRLNPLKSQCLRLNWLNSLFSWESFCPWTLPLQTLLRPRRIWSSRASHQDEGTLEGEMVKWSIHKISKMVLFSTVQYFFYYLKWRYCTFFSWSSSKTWYVLGITSVCFNVMSGYVWDTTNRTWGCGGNLMKTMPSGCHWNDGSESGHYPRLVNYSELLQFEHSK